MIILDIIFSLTYTNISFCLYKLFENHRFFFHGGIQDVDISISYKANTIHVTQKLHPIKTKSYQNLFEFDRRKESWFCSIFREDTQSIEIYENKISNYLKPWKHMEPNIKGKMPLASLEEMKLDDNIVSIDGDKIYDLVRECNITIVQWYVLCSKIGYVDNELLVNEDEFDTWHYLEEMSLLWLHP